MHRCFFCGGLCGEEMPTASFVKKSFTGLDTVTLSPWVCLGCVASQDERANITLADGEVRESQKVRGYSWVIDGAGPIAATKAHREWLIGKCLSPPEPPFVICISDSGQKHLLYRAVVCHSREVVTVTLEGQVITYRPHKLQDRLDLCKRICAATGKPAMVETLTSQSQMRVVEHYDSDEWLTEWLAVAESPLTKLATWLTPKREDCENEHPAATAHVTEPIGVARHGAAQKEFGWTC